LHLVGILFPHINDDARSKSHQRLIGLILGFCDTLHRISADFPKSIADVTYCSSVLVKDGQFTGSHPPDQYDALSNVQNGRYVVNQPTNQRAEGGDLRESACPRTIVLHIPSH